MSVAFDHLMVMVADEAVAAQEFSQAGFAVTPRSELPGMANRLVCFPSSVPNAACFIELLSVERPDDVPPRIRSFVGSQLGPIAVVFAVPDLAALKRRLNDKAVDVFGPLEIRRRWTLPSGETLDVALDIVIGDAEALPFRWAAVQHYTVEHYQRADFLIHASGVKRLRAIAIVIDDPRGVATRMEALFGCKYRCVGEAAIVTLGNAPLLLLADGQRSGSGCGERGSIAGAILQGEIDDRDFDDVIEQLVSKMLVDGCVGTTEISHLKLFTLRHSRIV
jgi:hypothetical protein